MEMAVTFSTRRIIMMLWMVLPIVSAFYSVYPFKTCDVSLVLHSTTERVSSVSLPEDFDSDRSVYIETHGCQMNLADSDIVRSILSSMNFTLSPALDQLASTPTEIDQTPSAISKPVDLILINTCAIRENAEERIKQRIKYFLSLRKQFPRKLTRFSTKPHAKAKKSLHLPVIGVLGCMAERLQTELLQEMKIDFVAGPDQYRDLVHLIPAELQSLKRPQNRESVDVLNGNDAQEVIEQGHEELNRAAAKGRETYEDIQPLRVDEGQIHAFVTIMRGKGRFCACVPCPRLILDRCMLKAVTITARFASFRSREDESVLYQFKRLSTKFRAFYGQILS